MYIRHPLRVRQECLRFHKQSTRRLCAKLAQLSREWGGRQSREDTETFARFCGQTKVELAEPKTPALGALDEPKAECVLPMEPERMTIVINGNLEKLAAYIKLLPMNGRLRMTLTLERTEEE